MKSERLWLIAVLITASLTLTTQGFGMWSTPVWHAPAESTNYLVPVYNQDQLEGNWKQFKGELKKKWADLTDDDLLYIEGQKDRLEGKIQERYGERREEVEQWVEEWFETHDHEGKPRQ